jgi:predicted RNase H-like HicB family nuclease
MEDTNCGELVFDVYQEADGGYYAVCRTEAIITQGNTREELRANVREATRAFFFDGLKPQKIKLRIRRRRR